MASDENEFGDDSAADTEDVSSSHPETAVSGASNLGNGWLGEGSPEGVRLHDPPDLASLDNFQDFDLLGLPVPYRLLLLAEMAEVVSSIAALLAHSERLHRDWLQKEPMQVDEFD